MAEQRRVYSLAERRALLLRRSELATLAQLPAWEVYQAVIRERIEEIQHIVVAKAMSDKGISAEEQAFHRGRIRALRSIATIPDNANNKVLMEELAEQEVAE